MSRIEELEKRLAADPNSRIFVQLAEEYRKQGLLENAIEVCEAGLQKHPQYPSARVALGRALLEAETFDRASEEFEAVLAQVPDNILANKFLGETYHRLGRYDEAIQKYQIAQTLAPEDTELEDKIEAVKAEMAGGGPPPPTSAPEPAGQAAPPDPGQVASPPSGMGLSLGVDEGMRPVSNEPLEPTLVDAQAAAADVGPPPPPAPAEAEPAEAEAPAPPQDDLAPIPLVEVDEPMVLESPAESYARASEPPAGAAPVEPAEPVPLMSPSDPPPMEPPPMEPPPMEPPPMEPPPMEPPPMEPPPMEPPPMEPPPMEPPPMEPPPVFEAPPMVEAPPMEPPVIEATPVEPLPLEPVPVEPRAVEPAPPGERVAPEGDDIETPTMAELYASQGHFDKAVTVYRNLLTRDPNETQYLERIEELEMLAKATADSASAAPAGPADARGDGLSGSGRQQTIEVLEQWLEGIRRSRRA